MKVKISIFIMILILGCSVDEVYFDTVLLGNGLYVEKYKNPGGAHGGDYIYCYLTDSSRFRKFIGKYEERQYLGIEENGKYVSVKKYSKGRGETKRRELLDSISYDIKVLILNGEFDK